MSRQEIKILECEDTGIFDICFDENGDFLNEDSWDTDIFMSWFTDKRAEPSQVAQPELRRGWFGDEYATLDLDQIGSHIWLLEQARNTNETANDARLFFENALNWMIEKNYATKITVTSTKVGTSSLQVKTVVTLEDDRTLSFSFDLWKESRFFLNVLPDCSCTGCFGGEDTGDNILLESGDNMLLESGDLILLE